MNFDPIDYFQTIQRELKLLQGDNRFFRVTGLSNLEELLQQRRSAVYPLLCVDDSQDGIITEISQGYWDSRYYSVFILAKVKVGSSADRNTKMEDCREIFFKILTRMIRDSQTFSEQEVMLHPDRINYDEVGYIGDHLFGIHFGFTVETPKELIYNDSDWDLGSS